MIWSFHLLLRHQLQFILSSEMPEYLFLRIFANSRWYFKKFANLVNESYVFFVLPRGHSLKGPWWSCSQMEAWQWHQRFVFCSFTCWLIIRQYFQTHSWIRLNWSCWAVNDSEHLPLPLYLPEFFQVLWGHLKSHIIAPLNSLRW